MSKKSSSEMIREHLDMLATLGKKQEVTESPKGKKKAVAEAIAASTKAEKKVVTESYHDRPYEGPPRFSVLDEDMESTLGYIKEADPETYARIMRWD